MAEESTSLNFDANIIVSGVRVSPNVRNTLAAISDLSQSKPINQTVNVRYNVEQIDSVTKQGSELASNLKEIFGKTQLAPNVVFNTKEIIAATSKLEQVKSALSTIGALMKAIQANRFAIPNSGEELGRLAVLQRTLSSLKQQAEKGVKFQFSAPLTEVRALDARIIGANTNVEQLKRSLAELGKEKVKVEVQVAEKKPQLVAEQEKLRKAIEKRKSKERDAQPRIEEERNRVKQLEDEIARTRAKLGGVVNAPRGSEEAIKIKSAKLQEAKVERVRVKDLLDQQISASAERIDAQKNLVKQEQDALDAISKEATSRARKRLLDENDKAGKDFRAKNKTLLDRLAQEEKIASDRETELKTVSKAREQAQIDALARQAKAELELEKRQAKFEETNPIKKGQRVNLAERRRELLQFTEPQRKELEIANVDVARIEKATPEGIAKLEAEKAAAEQEFNKASKTLQERQKLIGKNKSTEFTKILKDLNKEVDDARNRFNQISSELSAVRRFAAAPNLESLQTRTQEARAKADQTRAKLETKLEGPAKFIGSADPQVKEQEKKLRDAQKSLSKTQAQEVGTLEPYRVSVKKAQEAVTKLDDELKQLKETSKDKTLQTPQQILETIKKLESRREKTLQLIEQLERGGADQQLKAVRNQLRKKNLELKALEAELQQASSETAPVSQPIGPVLVAKTTEGASANELAKARAAAEEQLFQARLEVAQKSLTLEQRRSGAAKVGREDILETKKARETLREPVQVAQKAAETEKAAKNRLDISRSIRESTISTLTKELRSADDDLRNILKNFKVTKSLELGLQDAKDQFVEARKTFQKELAKLDKTDVNFDALKKSLFESTVGSAKKALEAVKAEYKAARELAVRPLATRRGELSTQLRTEEAKTGSDVREAEAEYRAAQLNTLEQKRQVELSRQALLLRVGLKKETEAVSEAAGRVRKAQNEYNAALKQQESVEDRIAKANSENAAQLENIKNTQAAVNAELAKTIALRDAEKAALASTRAANDAAVQDKKKSLQADRASLLLKKAEIDTILAGVEDTKLRARIEKNLNRVVASRSAFVANEEKRTQFSTQREAEKSVRQSELERLQPQAVALRDRFAEEKKALKAVARERTLALEDEYRNLGKLAAGITIKRPEKRTKEEQSVISRRAAIEKEKGQIEADLKADISNLQSAQELAKLEANISRLQLELTALKSVERVTKQLGLDEAIKKAENLDKQLKKGLITKQQRDQGLIDIFSSDEDSTKLTKDEQKLLAQQRLELARIVVAEKEINAEIKAANDALRTSIRGHKELNSILTVQREITGLIVSTAKQEQEVAVASATAKADVGRRNKVIIDQAEQLVKLEQRSAALAKERARLERVPKIFGPDLPARGVFGTTLRKEADQGIRSADKKLKEEQAELEARTARLNELRNKALSGETLGAAERKEIASIVEDLSRATANLAATESKGAASIAAAEQNLKKAVAERIALQEKLNTNETTKKNLETNKTQLEARLKALKAEIAEIEQSGKILSSTSSKTGGVAKPLFAAQRIKEELANLDEQLLRIEERRASLNNEIVRQQEIESRLIAEQAEKAKQVTVEENKRFGIAQKLNKIIDSNIEKESAFQRRQATAFEKRGEFYTKPDSRAKTLERLGITEAEATSPTEDVLARARAARPGAARQEELFANIDKFSKEDRSELVRKNLQKVLDVQEKIAKARAKTSVLDSEDLAKQTEDRLKESLKRVFGQDITLPEVQILVDASGAAEVVRILKSITNELDLQKKALKDQVQVNQEVISLEKARRQVLGIIEDEVRNEAKFRSKLKDTLAQQGVTYNAATGMARKEVRPGELGPEYVPEGTTAGSLRAVAISRLGITESEAQDPGKDTLERIQRRRSEPSGIEPEIISGLISDAKLSKESLLKLFTDAKLPADALTKLVADAKLPADTLTKLVAGAKLPADALAKLIADAKLKPDALSRLLTEAELQPDAITRLLTEAELPNDALTKLLSAAELKPDAITRLLADADLPPDALSKLIVDAKLPPDAIAKLLADAKLEPNALEKLIVDAKLDPKALIDLIADAKLEPDALAKLIVDAKLPKDAILRLINPAKLPPDAIARLLNEAKLPREAITDLFASAKLPADALANLISDAKLSPDAVTELISGAELSPKAVTDLIADAKLPSDALIELLKGAGLRPNALTDLVNNFKLSPTALTKLFEGLRLSPEALTKLITSGQLSAESITKMIPSSRSAIDPDANALERTIADAKLEPDAIAKLISEAKLAPDALIKLIEEAKLPRDAFVKLIANAKLPTDALSKLIAGAKLPSDALIELIADAKLPPDALTKLLTDAKLKPDALKKLIIDAKLPKDAISRLLVEAKLPPDALIKLLSVAKLPPDALTKLIVDAELPPNAIKELLTGAKLSPDSIANLLVDAKLSSTAITSLIEDAKLPKDAITKLLSDGKLTKEDVRKLIADAKLPPDAISKLIVDAKLSPTAITTLLKDAKLKPDAIVKLLTDAKLPPDALIKLIEDAELKPREIVKLLANAKLSKEDTVKLIAEAKLPKDAITKLLTDAKLKPKDLSKLIAEAKLSPDSIENLIKDSKLQPDSLIKLIKDAKLPADSLVKLIADAKLEPDALTKLLVDAKLPKDALVKLIIDSKLKPDAIVKLIADAKLPPDAIAKLIADAKPSKELFKEIFSRAELDPKAILELFDTIKLPPEALQELLVDAKLRPDALAKLFAEGKLPKDAITKLLKDAKLPADALTKLIVDAKLSPGDLVKLIEDAKLPPDAISVLLYDAKLGPDDLLKLIEDAKLPADALLKLIEDAKLPRDAIAKLIANAKLPADALSKLIVDAKLQPDLLGKIFAQAKLPADALTKLIIDAKLPKDALIKLIVDAKLPPDAIAKLIVGAKLPKDAIAKLLTEAKLPKDALVKLIVDAKLPKDALEKLLIGAKLEPDTVKRLISDANLKPGDLIKLLEQAKLEPGDLINLLADAKLPADAISKLLVDAKLDPNALTKLLTDAKIPKESIARAFAEAKLPRDQRSKEFQGIRQNAALEELNKQTLVDTQKLLKNEIDLRKRKRAVQVSSLIAEEEETKIKLAAAMKEFSIRRKDEAEAKVIVDPKVVSEEAAEISKYLKILVKLSAQIKELSKPIDSAAIQTELLTKLFGDQVTTVEQLVDKLAQLDKAQAQAASSRVSEQETNQIAALKEQGKIESDNEKRTEQAARKRQKDTDSINKSIERTIDLYEKQIRTSNNLARTGARDLSGNRIPTITVDREALRAKVTRDLTGGVDLSTATDSQLAALSKSASVGLKERERLLVQFNDDVKAASKGAVSGFEIIAKYGDSAFTRLGGRIGFATEKLIAYAFSGGALYTVIGATRQAIVETALLEKEITNIQQIFSSSTGAEAYGESFDKSLGSAINTAKNVKDLILDISEVTGQSSIELAKAAKTLAAAGFGQGRPGFESTIRAVSFASLGPSFGNVEEIIDGLIASVNQFNRELTETPYILGLVNEYSKAYAVEAQDLFEAIKRGGGSFASVGGSLEDFLKLVTVARERTREAAPVIGTFLKTLSSRLFAPRTDKLLGELGLDPNTLLDPYERLLAISREISREGIGGGASVTILSELVDSRQTGRLYALLDALDEFDAKSKDLTGSATDSIVRDAQQRLDDIGPAIDRIKQSYFRFIEGIYNNPATKALITIPGGLLNLLSKVPSLGGGIGGNIAAPAVQTLGAIGITGLIKAQIAASKENRAAAAQNSENLRNLRVAIEKLAAEINANTSSTNANTQAENTNTQAENSNTAATSKQTAAAIASGGTFSGAFGGKRGFYTALGLGTIIPAVANSVAPMITSDQRSIGYTSSIAGGVGIGAAVGSLFPGPGTLIGAGAGGLLGLISQIVENTAQDEQLEELKRQTKLAEDAQAIQKIISTGQIPKNQVSARLATPDAETFARRLGDLQTIERLVGGERKAEIAGYSPEDFINDLLNPNTAFQAEAKKKREASFKEFFEGDENRIKEAESAVSAIQDTLRTAIINVFLQEAKGIGQDTVEARQKIIDEVSKQLSTKLNVEGIKIKPEQIEKVLSIFTDIDPATKNLTQGLQTLKLSIRSLYDEAEIAGKILSSLTAELTRSIQTQNIGLQRLFDQVKRSVGSIETAKDILASPFKGVSIRPLDQNATSETAARTIESITGQNVQRISSPETTRLLGVLEGFFDEFSRASIQDRQSIIRALDDERLKAIGGVEEQDTEAAGAMVNLSDRARSVRDQIELAIAPLENIGPASRELFKIISSAGTGLAIDIRELQKAIVAPDANAAERVLGLENARRALIEQANLLIEQQNYSLQQQLQAQEALVFAIEARKRAEIERTDTFIDNASKIVSLQSGAGLNNPAAAAEQTISARFAANKALFPPIKDVNVAVDAIAIAKELRLELGRALERVGSVQTVSERGQPVASPRFEVENAKASTKAVVRVLNSLGLSDREDTKAVIEKIQSATTSGLIQTESKTVSKVEGSIQDLLQSIKDSLARDDDQSPFSTVGLLKSDALNFEEGINSLSFEEMPNYANLTAQYDQLIRSAYDSFREAQSTLLGFTEPSYGEINRLTREQVDQNISAASKQVEERGARLDLVRQLGVVLRGEDKASANAKAVRGGILDKQSLDTFDRILTLLKQKNIKIDDARLISVLQAIQTSTEQISPSVEKAVNRRDVIVPKDTASAAQVQILSTIQKSLEGQASSVSLSPNTVADLFAGVRFDTTPKGILANLNKYAKLVSDTFNKLKPNLDPSVTLREFIEALREASFVDEATVGTATGQQVGAVGAADTASVQARVQQFIDKFRQLGQASLTRPFDDLASTIASLSFDQATLESSLKLSIDGSKQLFKIFEDNTNRLSQKLQNQKGLIDSLFGKIYGGSPQDQAIQKANVQRAAQQANRLAGAIANQIPNAQQLGTTQIMQNPQIAQIVQRVVKTLPTGDVGSLVDFLKTVNQNTFLASGLTGEQLSAAITGAFANEFAKLTGVDISQGSITQTSNQLDANLQALQTVNSTILQSQQALEKVMSVNLNLLQDETSKLTKALSSIPNEINVVIKGIENINVDFDMSNVNNSIKTVGTAVFGQIVNYLKNAFQRSGVPIEFGEGEFTLNQGESK